jgi:glycosyltransferase involved in cell wall biosynthesis
VSQPDRTTTIVAALAQRLRAIAPNLLGAGPPPVHPGTDPAADANIMLELLIHAVREEPGADRFWLLCVGAGGALPRAESVSEGLGLLDSGTDLELMMWLLDLGVDPAAAAVGTAEIEMVTGQVLLDVDHSAVSDLHTGIQQVVRSTVPIWARDHPVLPVAWTRPAVMWRTLDPRESARASRRGSIPDDWAKRQPAEPRMVVPWRTVVVLAETLVYAAPERLRSVAQYSGNSVVAIGYDCIPVVNADLVPAAEPDRFARYLTVVKHCKRVAAISASAATEFQGFADALAAQGLAGPTVVECRLPTEYLHNPAENRTANHRPPVTRTPVVLCPGSLEPRKNHLGVLYASERLWREGLDFELVLIADSGWGEEIPERIDRLRDSGRPISVKRKVRDEEMADAYREARFVVFPSYHEGFGLPVAEAFSLGTPVITSNVGGTADLGRDGGAVLVDPFDDEALVAAMRLLLTDDAKLRSVKGEIAGRPPRSWDDYAADLWQRLVEPELVIPGRQP